MSEQDTNIIEVGEEELTPDVAIDTIKQATEISHILHKLTVDDDFRDISLEDMQRLQDDIWSFVAASLKGELSGVLERLNIMEFDKDHQSGLDIYEFQNYVTALNISLQAIVELDGTQEYDATLTEAYGFSTGEYQDWIQSWTREKIRGIRNEIGTVTDIDPLYLEEIKNLPFEFPYGFLKKEFWIIVASEGGDVIEDMIDVVVSIIPAIWRLSYYLELREKRNSLPQSEQARIEIQINELIHHNPIFGLGEISLEDLKELGELLMSGTNEGVVVGITSAIALIAGGVGVAKLGSKAIRGNKVEDFDRIEPPLSKVDSAHGDQGSSSISPDLQSIRDSYRIDIPYEEMNRLSIGERIQIAEETFGRQFNLGELELIGRVNSMSGNRREKIKIFTTHILEIGNGNIFPDTLEIRELFYSGVISTDS